MHSQSSLSGRSIASNSSGSGSDHGSGTSGSGSATRSHNSSANTVMTRTTSISGGPTESVGQLSLQRFPTGESEYKVRPVSTSGLSTGQGLGAQTKVSRTASVVSSARSSSGSSGFKFSFKPLLYNHGNDSKQQQHLYHHHNGSSPATSPIGHHQALDPFANSPFPAILMSIKLPQSLLDKYMIDQESFRQGKGVWGIGKYSWTITVLSRANGKKYVIKRVSKSLLPPSAYYHYPTTAHRLCTCPACKSLREQLLLAGQLPDNELKNLQEVLVIHNKGRRKDLPQLPPSSPQQSRQHQPQRPVSASSISSPTTSNNNAKESKDKQRRSFNLYSCHNASTPNHTSKFSAFSPITTPQDTPVNSRPSTPAPSPLRILSTPSPPHSSSTLTSSSPLPALPAGHGKIHNSTSNSITSKSQTAQSSLIPSPSPLLPAEPPLSWSQKTRDAMVSQGRPTDPSRYHQQQDALRSPGIPPRSAGTSSSSQRTRPTLQRHASTPNMSRAVTGLDVLETDPTRLDQLNQLSRLGSHGGGSGGGRVISFGRDRDYRKETDSRLAPLRGDRPLSDSPLSMTMTMQALYESTLGNGADGHHQDDDDDDSKEASVEYERTPTTTHSALRRQTSTATAERKVSPFDTNDGEFKQMESESPESLTARARNGATSAPLMFTPPPHALPMELVLLQTYNDSDHLPEHHEWTQDEDYWYYVTKAHGVRRRKLKKVSSWWLDLSSLGGALLSAGSSSSREPIATEPIYNMGRAPGTSTVSTTPHTSSPLSSELALASPSLTATDTRRRTHAPKESISSMASQETVNANSAAFKRQSSPRNSTSLMGKYYYVDWDEYLSL
ncbi:hypothetical protein BGZ47_002545 [Haplosporangium gracile]|nr:hypothetical protein BGZ47_002545 [Haplosporangium gracile]